MLNCENNAKLCEIAAMNYEYEHIIHQDQLPLHIFLHNIKECAYHAHKDLELLFVLQGTILVYVEGKKYLLKPSDLLLIHCHEIHLSYDAGDQNVILALQINPSFAEKYDPDVVRRRFEFNALAAACPDDKRCQTVRSLMAHMMWEMRMKKPGFQFQVESLLHSLYRLLLREFSHSIRDARAEDALRDDQLVFSSRVKRIIRRIENHYQDKLQLSDLAREERLSVGHLSRFFKEHAGQTFSEFVNLVRLQKSFAALAETDHTIARIAMDYGFSSVKTYNIVFKRMCRTTPSAWRKRIRGQGPSAKEVSKKICGQCDQNSALALLTPYLPGILD